MRTQFFFHAELFIATLLPKLLKQRVHDITIWCPWICWRSYLKLKQELWSSMEPRNFNDTGSSEAAEFLCIPHQVIAVWVHTCTCKWAKFTSRIHMVVAFSGSLNHPLTHPARSVKLQSHLALLSNLLIGCIFQCSTSQWFGLIGPSKPDEFIPCPPDIWFCGTYSIIISKTSMTRSTANASEIQSGSRSCVEIDSSRFACPRVQHCILFPVKLLQNMREFFKFSSALRSPQVMQRSMYCAIKEDNAPPRICSTWRDSLELSGSVTRRNKGKYPEERVLLDPQNPQCLQSESLWTVEQEELHFGHMWSPPM
jgi:hypothetical protein